MAFIRANEDEFGRFEVNAGDCLSGEDPLGVDEFQRREVVRKQRSSVHPHNDMSIVIRPVSQCRHLFGYVEDF
eukprot:CAMPEP_0202976978 /NCGR_PEP_ID=MMETSP1396-20130829/82312_1 /ASSEMBLY_ACC=CAM_ASM_000872 /TAXON_ID= /ORGANISM="Pseudokeronopsis sp., Strain Brazil" /LENGTH=72 /DNA_ID=CAMNT_0049715293 /DNA_START=126 /DNA_END=344 /DNA_ORIENTATION=-